MGQLKTYVTTALRPPFRALPKIWPKRNVKGFQLCAYPPVYLMGNLRVVFSALLVSTFHIHESKDIE
jgi:hypothetical protein